MFRTTTLTAAALVLAVTGASAQSPVVTSDSNAATPMHDDRVAPNAAVMNSGVSDAGRMVDSAARGILGGIASPTGMQVAQNQVADEDNAADRAEGERLEPGQTMTPATTTGPNGAANTSAANEDNAANRAEGERVEPNETMTPAATTTTMGGTTAETGSANTDDAADRAEGERVKP